MILPTALLANLLPPTDLGSLRAIGFGGEACPSSLVGAGGRVALFNMYGPTECTVTALCARLTRGAHHHRSPHQQPEVTDPGRGGQPLPGGVPGELCLAGLGLAAATSICRAHPGGFLSSWPLMQRMRNAHIASIAPAIGPCCAATATSVSGPDRRADQAARLSYRAGGDRDPACRCARSSARSRWWCRRASARLRLFAGRCEQARRRCPAAASRRVPA